MQTIYLDISNKGVVPTVYAKQGDVGRRFLVVLTDSGTPYSLPAGSVFSVWYEGDSGEGNYTDIGEQSAFSINENAVTVEMIEQMLSVAGNGILCLTLNKADGGQIGSWNIPYVCERIPGFESEEATSYYTAFSETVKNLQKMVETDPTVPNWAKAPKKPVYTASEVGARPNTWMPTASDVGAAPAGYGLGGFAVPVPGNNLDTLKANGWYYCADSTAGGPSGYALGNAVVEVSAGWAYSPVHQTLHFGTAGRQPFTIKRYWNNATNSWVDWEWINPPMLTGVEYRTTERYNGKPVYTKLVNLGVVADQGSYSTGVSGVVIRYVAQLPSAGITVPYNGRNTAYFGTSSVYVCLATDGGIWYSHWVIGSSYSGRFTANIQLWYTKD